VRVVLDVNVLISARLSPLGPSARLLAAWTEERFDLIVSPALLDELADVLSRERLRRWLSPDEATAFAAVLRAGAIMTPDPPAEPGVTPDPDDDYLVALARATGSDLLVSGDSHLLGLSDPSPPVLTPRAFLELLER
jgi:putative PIN family toxin of toxin-antitoxin system